MLMLALFVKIPTMYRLRKIRSLLADSKYILRITVRKFASHISAVQ